MGISACTHAQFIRGMCHQWTNCLLHFLESTSLASLRQPALASLLLQQGRQCDECDDLGTHQSASFNTMQPAVINLFTQQQEVLIFIYSCSHQDLMAGTFALWMGSHIQGEGQRLLAGGRVARVRPCCRAHQVHGWLRAGPRAHCQPEG